MVGRTPPAMQEQALDYAPNPCICRAPSIAVAADLSVDNEREWTVHALLRGKAKSSFLQHGSTLPTCTGHIYVARCWLCYNEIKGADKWDYGLSLFPLVFSTQITTSLPVNRVRANLLTLGSAVLLPIHTVFLGADQTTHTRGLVEQR